MESLWRSDVFWFFFGLGVGKGEQKKVGGAEGWLVWGVVFSLGCRKRWERKKMSLKSKTLVVRK